MSWPKLLILDCDGVLVDSEPLACEADAAAVQIFGTKMLSSAQAMKRFTGKSAAYMRDVLTHEFGVTDIDGCMQKKDDILWGLYREKLHTTPGLLAALHKLREAGIPVISEMEFAGRYLGKARTICVTGSNGKTTTTSLIYKILRDAGYNVALGGNIGESFAYSVATGDYDWYVLELSSFQLDGMFRFRAHIGVLTNITPDPLDPSLIPI